MLHALSKCTLASEFSIKYKMKDYSQMKELLLEKSVSDAKNIKHLQYQKQQK
ncbi:hypothetical protein [Clostridium beijerinckii]|uniref:hypothetical protein n=1 Tax=Clostridium beijerinckii TaxID=1520 RepID=UPI000A952876|nr:hypothetical protein [Clostridium beijerinckii]